MTRIAVDLTLYSPQALFRAMYQFTGDFFVHVERRDATSVDVHLRTKDGSPASVDLPGRFSNMLVDEQVRFTVAEETRAVRELLVAEAFAAVDLLDTTESEADYNADSRGIALR